MPTKLNSNPRSGARRGVTSFFVACLLVGLCAIGVGALLGGCKPNDRAQVVQAASVVPTPSATTSATIRTKVAALVKAEVQRHPGVSGWANELAKTCFALSGAKLPAPDTLRSYFTLASYFVPSDYAQSFASLSGDVANLYAADYPAAVATQTVGTPYLTLLGQGIQDGIKAAAVGEAP